MKTESPPQFAAGDRVLIEDLGLACHYRVPMFVRGLVGTVDRYCGRFPNPEAIAYGDRAAPAIELYRLRFRQREVWPDYDGGPEDALFIEVYRHWLRAAPDAVAADHRG